jgi:hypothetical protein
MLPLVGEVPNKKGLWVAVGFHGECEDGFAAATALAGSSPAEVA